MDLPVGAGEHVWAAQALIGRASSRRDDAVCSLTVTPPEILFARGDADSDGNINITDGIRTLSWLFTGGAPPAPPTPTRSSYAAADCGADPTPDVGLGLGCASPSSACK